MSRKPILISLLILSIGFSVSGTASADSSLTIHNDVNTSSSNTSSSQCHTVVHLTVNGEEQDMVSDDCDHNVNVSNGNNSIHISNNTDGNAHTYTKEKNDQPTLPSISPYVTQSISSEAAKMRHNDQRIHQQQEHIHHAAENLWTQFTSWLQHLF